MESRFCHGRIKDVMGLRILLLLTLLLILPVRGLHAQDWKISLLERDKSIEAVKAKKTPHIDGKLDDPCWRNVPVATDFLQVNPYNGRPASQRTEVKFLYDDNAVYIGAMLYDPAPDSIMTVLDKRDQFSISDYFGVLIDPFNDSQLAYAFYVTAAGVQVDYKSIDGQRNDRDWDAVWDSEINILWNGWTVEMKIPYSALRFPKKDIHEWGINIFRNVRRTRESTSWNYVDQEVSGVNQQAGTMKGVKNVAPPLRLAFLPYAAAYVEKYSDHEGYGSSLKGGMDMKYGINESYTLDMMLIPDFGQVQSDDEVLNLSPFETYYGEKREFFMEGTELFNRANIFYSRRIGDRPKYHSDVDDKLRENEVIVENPAESQLINATKVTGKTPAGWSTGLLNAMAMNTFATIKDTLSGEERKVLTQPFTNYNLTVVEKTLRNNSFVSLINSNVHTPHDNYTANVVGAQFKLANKDNSYAFSGRGAISKRFSEENEPGGGYYDLEYGKIKGNFLWELSTRLETDQYDPNDLGFMRANNEISYALRMNYNIYDPFWKVLGWYNYFRIALDQRFRPLDYQSFTLSAVSSTTFRNYTYARFNLTFRPQYYDYYEPRVDGRKFKEAGFISLSTRTSTDYRKKFAIDLGAGYFVRSEYNNNGFNYRIEPRYRISDKMIIVFEYRKNKSYNNLGYVGNNEVEDSIYFGRRDLNTIENTLVSNYTFNNKTSLSFRLRHYWSRVEYKDYYLLGQDGSLQPGAGYSEDNLNFNAFNIDMVYSWRFAPGSELSIVWKNAIEAEQNIIVPDYPGNLESTFSAPQLNSISIKVLYYLDYLYLKKKISS